MTGLIDEIVEAWADLVPVAAYTGGRTASIGRLVHRTPDAARSALERRAALAGVPAIEFNTAASAMGFASWPVDVQRLASLRGDVP